MLKKPWAHKLPPRASCNHIELSKRMVPIFFFFSALTKYKMNNKMNSNIENDYAQCFIGNHLK